MLINLLYRGLILLVLRKCEAERRVRSSKNQGSSHTLRNTIFDASCQGQRN